MILIFYTSNSYQFFNRIKERRKMWFENIHFEEFFRKIAAKL